MPENTKQEVLASSRDYTKYDFHYNTKDYDVILEKGLNEDIVKQISKIKNEPQWMLDFRLKALKAFMEKAMPSWGANLSKINFDEITYYLKPSGEKKSWEEVPQYIKETFDRLGIPDAERKFLAGVGAQIDSEVVYHNIRKDLEKLGVVFLSMDEGLKQFPEIVKKYFATIIPLNDNKFAALNSAVWSGGSFVFIPPNTKVHIPLQAYFRINAERMGQFERTLIVVGENSQVHYIEGCFTAGTEIKTYESPKKIEEIKVGEKVLTHTGEYKKVYHTQVRPYTGKIYSIEYVINGKSVKTEATEEHPFLGTKQKEGKLEWINANKLQQQNYLAVLLENTQTSEEISIGNQQMLQKINAKYAFVPIKKISAKEVENLPVYNFSVEKDESYIANGVAVHNCTAPQFSSDSLHAAVVEVIALPGAHVRYTTIQNWADNIYNLVTKRAYAYRDSTVEWIDCNLGSQVTMKYPSVYLMEAGSKAEILSVALAGKNQHQDAGAKVIHLASNTTSRITSKSISKDGGRTSYRGQVKVYKGAKNVKSNVVCDALILDKDSRSDTYPCIDIDEPTATIAHEASVGKISEEQLFYLMSRGLKEQEALTMIVMGFIQPFAKTLPMEYAIELNRLIEVQMENSVG